MSFFGRIKCAFGSHDMKCIRKMNVKYQRWIDRDDRSGLAVIEQCSRCGTKAAFILGAASVIPVNVLYTENMMDRDGIPN